MIDTATDITQRKEVEAAIVASEARLRRVIASPILGIAFGDAQGAITEANDECCVCSATRADVRARRLEFAHIMLTEAAVPTGRLSRAKTNYNTSIALLLTDIAMPSATGVSSASGHALASGARALRPTQNVY